MDGQDRGHVEAQYHNQQEQMRQREEEIARRHQEHKRRHEQEGIARRQHESEEAARAARQSLVAPRLPYPPNNISPNSTGPHPASFYPTHLGPSSSTAPKPMFYSSAVQYPTLGPTAMPLESPHYEGDSTDSESLNRDLPRLNRLKIDSDSQKSPAKPVRR